MIQGIDHIGIAVSSIAEAVPFYRDTLGLTPSSIEEVPSQQVRTLFFLVNSVKIELLEATSDQSPIARFIKKNGPGIHHVALKTDNVQEQLELAKINGCQAINDKPFEGANSHLVAFLHPKSTGGVLFELTEQLKISRGLDS